MTDRNTSLARVGRFPEIPRARLVNFFTPLEHMPNLSRFCGSNSLYVKRDDCTGLAFGGNKVRQLEFYLGEAIAQNADTILITGAVQSNFVRSAAAASCKLGMECHVQHEERVADTDAYYRESGNVLIDKLLGATIYSYPVGEDEAGADRQIESIARRLAANGRQPYVIHLAPEHPPLGALGYAVAAEEILAQCRDGNLHFDRIFVGSGSGATHSGLLFGLRSLGSPVPVTGVCVRREATSQRARIKAACERIADLLGVDNTVADEDIVVEHAFLAPGYGIPGEEVMEAIVRGARKEGLITDPVYTGKVLAAFIDYAHRNDAGETCLFVHTGGTPGLFAYQHVIEQAVDKFATQ